MSGAFWPGASLHGSNDIAASAFSGIAIILGEFFDMDNDIIGIARTLREPIESLLDRFLRFLIGFCAFK